MLTQYVVKCPECKHNMRYVPIKQGLVTDKKKKCVYCGHTFKIHANYNKSRIVEKEEKNTSSMLFHNASQIKEFQKKIF